MKRAMVRVARAMATATKRAMVTNSNNTGFIIKKSLACGGKTVSTRAHIHKVQHYLRKTTLQAELCS
jgi:hypothetical protein